MNTQTATGGRIVRFGWLLFALPALMALPACTNATSTASTNAPSGAVRVAGEGASGGGTHSVDAVSDVLGQRLDGMLSTRPSGNH